MRDNVLMENYLLILKSDVEVFVHGTLESSYDDNQSLLLECLNDIIDCQRRTYVLMTDQGMYNIEGISSTLISDCISKNSFE